MDWCIDTKAGVELRVRLTPRASRDAIVEIRDGALCVRVTAAPVDGRANRALVQVLAERLGVARGRVRIVAGETSRTKRVLVSGIDVATARAKLPAAD